MQSTQSRLIMVLSALTLATTLVGHTAPTNPDVPISAKAAQELQRSASDYGIDFWREAEGLPQSRIRAIAQTRDGYLWLGTDSGLVRFNGLGFTVFNSESGSLRDNEVWAIQEDDAGGLWIGTYGGGLTLYKDSVFKTFTSAEGLPDDVVMRLSKDRAGNIWLGTPSGVARYAQGKFTTYRVSEGLIENTVTAICADSTHGVLIATGANLMRFENDRFTPVNGVIDPADGPLDQIVSSRDGSVWLSSRNRTVKRWTSSGITDVTRNQKLSSRISQIYEDPQGMLWVAMEQGVCRFKNGKFETVPLGDSTATPGVVYSIFTDREANVWIGFQSNGLGRLRTKQLYTISSTEGLPNDSTRSVFQDSHANIWIGTVNGFSRRTNGKLTSYQSLGSARIGSVRSFAEDRAGNVWIGADHDLLMMQGTRLVRLEAWHSATEIEALYADTNGDMWIGTDGDGLFQFVRNTFIQYRTQDGLASNQVRALLRDRNGALWISTFGKGVSKYVDGKFTNYTTMDGLAGNRVAAIFEDDEGSLWFASREGLSRLKDGKFFTFTAESGLLVSFVYSIVDDGKGNFWFSCAQGLFRVNRAELRDFAAGKIKRVTSVDYGVRDGLKTRACNVGDQPTAWKTSDGTLLFCTLKGVVVVDPARLYAGSLIPPVRIEKVVINKQEQQLNVDADMAPGSGDVDIQYAALSYVAPEKVRFKYKLEGYDKDWVDAGARRFAYYANLPPGKYNFRVIAGHIDGPWNETGAVFGFYLKPRFYQTRLFLVAAAVTVLLLVGAFYRLRVMELKARYSAVLGERNRIAREIHDTLAQNLAGIALQLDSVNMQTANMPNALRQRLDQACNLVRYSLSEARRAVADLRSDELERRELAVALPEIAEKMAAGAALVAHVEVIGTPRRLNPVTEKNLLRIFQEAMANAVKHADAQAISVELNYGPNLLSLSIQDDGSGFDTERIIPLDVGHYGLTGMRERAERIGGRFTLKSTIGKGTVLIVEVPLAAH